MAESPPPLRRAFSTAVDLETEEGRAFLQERLALFAKVGFFLSLGFYSIANLSSSWSLRRQSSPPAPGGG
jgi:hypothetical protein